MPRPALASSARMRRPEQMLQSRAFYCLVGFPIMDEQQAASCVGELLSALTLSRRIPSLEEQQAASSVGDLRKAEHAGKGVAIFWTFCCFAGFPIMEEQQTASSAGELREAEQAREGVAIPGFLPSCLDSHYGGVAGRLQRRRVAQG